MLQEIHDHFLMSSPCCQEHWSPVVLPDGEDNTQYEIGVETMPYIAIVLNDIVLPPHMQYARVLFC